MVIEDLDMVMDSKIHVFIHGPFVVCLFVCLFVFFTYIRGMCSQFWRLKFRDQHYNS